MLRWALLAVVGCGEHLDTTFVDAAPRDVLADAGISSQSCAMPRFPGWQLIAGAASVFGAATYVPADLDGDGAPELLGVDRFGALGSTAGIGDGTAAPLVTIASGLRNDDLVVQDLDGDGHLDVAYLAADGVAVQRGNGDGTFATPLVIRRGVDVFLMRGGPRELVFAAGSTVYLAHGHADGSFETSSWTIPDGEPVELAVGDFDRDGVADIALLVASSADTRVEIRREDGTLLGVRSFGTAGARMSAGDVDGDTNVDLVVSDGVSTFLARGDGAGGLGVMERLTSTVPQVQLVDLDRDGTMEIVGIDPGRSAVVRILPDTTVRTLSLVPLAQAVVVGDFDRDGRDDLATFTSNGIVVTHGNGDGTFVTPTATPLYSVQMGRFTDVDGDGLNDAVYVDRDLSKIGIAHARAGGTFDPPVEYDDFGKHPVYAVAADLDHDGMVDLIVENQAVTGDTFLSWWRGLGNGIFQLGPELQLDQPAGIRVADLDGDGWQEVLLMSGQVVELRNGELVVTSTLFSGTLELTAARLTERPLPDVVASDGILPQLQLRPNLGNHHFGNPVTVQLQDVPYRVSFADLDRDGTTDIVVAAADTVSVLRNRGNYHFVIDRYPIQSWAVTVGDVDGDGTLDLVASGASTLDVLLGHGDGTFAPPLVYPSFTPSAIDLRDTDGDGRTDIITLGQQPAQLTVTPQRCW